MVQKSETKAILKGYQSLSCFMSTDMRKAEEDIQVRQERVANL
jgi:hypothetical protein